MASNRQCWCGNDALQPFSDAYLLCSRCNSLVLKCPPGYDVTRVTDGNGELYSKDYYITHLPEKYGYPDLATRARTDLPERCLYWMRALLKYKLPPAKVLELGSVHGGFVSMLRWAGYDATGLELSPWLVEYAKTTFGVPMLTGPIEDQDIDEGSFDAIVLMDVLEHLPDPINTLKKCLNLLKPDGIMLIQTPCCPEDCSYEQMLSHQSPFLEQLKYEEHLYLFSERSVQTLLNRLDVANINFEAAIFSHYDMFLAAGKSPFTLQTSESIAAALSSGPESRLIQAMIDLDDFRKSVAGTLDVCEADRAARLEVIAQRGETIRQQAEAIRQQGETIRQMEIIQHDLKKELDDMKNSKSWKMTAALRQINRHVTDSSDNTVEDDR